MGEYKNVKKFNGMTRILTRASRRVVLLKKYNGQFLSYCIKENGRKVKWFTSTLCLSNNGSNLGEYLHMI
jgi:hypothetical protein